MQPPETIQNDVAEWVIPEKIHLPPTEEINNTHLPLWVGNGSFLERPNGK